MAKKVADSEKLDGKTKDILEKSFAGATKKVNKGDVAYIIDNGWDRIQEVSNATASYAKLLYKRSVLLYNLLVDWWNDTYQFPWRAIAAVAAALLYLINPFDLIPDFIPGIGYIDDAFMIGLCFNMINAELRDYCRFFHISPKEYDL